jgi:transcriptional regulator with XRE-family HTH domain
MRYPSLKSLRIGLSLTQQQAAEMCGISRVSFQQIESKNSTVGKLSEIAEKLGFDFEIVFSPKNSS